MPSSDPRGEPAPERGGAYTYGGPIHWEYAPEIDNDPDPGEIVWSWVAFEEDDGVGKDRPIAVVGRADDRRLVALMLSSRGHDGDRDWISIGRGSWDREGRNSWVRRDRVLAVAANAVRREGAIMPRETYDAIVAGMRAGATPSGPEAPEPPRRDSGLRARLRRILTGR